MKGAASAVQPSPGWAFLVCSEGRRIYVSISLLLTAAVGLVPRWLAAPFSFIAPLCPF